MTTEHLNGIYIYPTPNNIIYQIYWMDNENFRVKEWRMNEPIHKFNYDVNLIKAIVDNVEPINRFDTFMSIDGNPKFKIGSFRFFIEVK